MYKILSKTQLSDVVWEMVVEARLSKKMRPAREFR